MSNSLIWKNVPWDLFYLKVDRSRSSTWVFSIISSSMIVFLFAAAVSILILLLFFAPYALDNGFTLSEISEVEIIEFLSTPEGRAVKTSLPSIVCMVILNYTVWFVMLRVPVIRRFLDLRDIYVDEQGNIRDSSSALLFSKNDDGKESTQESSFKEHPRGAMYALACDNELCLKTGIFLEPNTVNDPLILTLVKLVTTSLLFGRSVFSICLSVTIVLAFVYIISGVVILGLLYHYNPVSLGATFYVILGPLAQGYICYLARLLKALVTLISELVDINTLDNTMFRACVDVSLRKYFYQDPSAWKNDDSLPEKA